MTRAAHRTLVAPLLVALALGWRVDRAEALGTETYLFRDSFEPSEGAGNVLVPVSNATGTIVMSGPDFVTGAFVTQSVSASVCPSTPEIRAWAFPASSGLRYPDVTPTLVLQTYSISMLIRHDPVDTGYARLIDFSQSTADAGLYRVGSALSSIRAPCSLPGRSFPGRTSW